MIIFNLSKFNKTFWTFFISFLSMLNIAFKAGKILAVFTLRHLNRVFFNTLFPYFEIRNDKFIAKHAYELLGDLLGLRISIRLQILDDSQLNMQVSLENMLKLLMNNFIQVFLRNMNFSFLNFGLNHMIKDDVWISRFFLFFLNLLHLNLFHFLLMQSSFLFLLSLKVVLVILLVLSYIHLYYFFSAAGSSHIFFIFLIILFITCKML